MALSADRLTRTRAASTARVFPLKLAANAIAYQGGMASVSATGYGKASDATAGTRVVGMFTAGADNTGGADGALSAEVRTGPAKMDNDATHPCTQADVGRVVYVKNDHTVQTAAGGSVVAAGILDQIDGDGGCWVVLGSDPALGDDPMLDASNVSATADGNTTGGIPVIHVFEIADTGASEDVDIVVTEKFELLDVTVIKSAAGAGNTLTVKNGATAITDAIAAAVDKAVTRAGTIDQAHSVIAAGGTLRASVTWAAGSGAMKVIVTGRKAA